MPSFSFLEENVKVLAQQTHFKPTFTLLSSGKEKKKGAGTVYRWILPEKSTGARYAYSIRGGVCSGFRYAWIVWLVFCMDYMQALN